MALCVFRSSVISGVCKLPQDETFCGIHFLSRDTSWLSLNLNLSYFWLHIHFAFGAEHLVWHPGNQLIKTTLCHVGKPHENKLMTHFFFFFFKSNFALNSLKLFRDFALDGNSQTGIHTMNQHEANSVTCSCPWGPHAAKKMYRFWKTFFKLDQRNVVGGVTLIQS